MGLPFERSKRPFQESVFTFSARRLSEGAKRKHGFLKWFLNLARAVQHLRELRARSRCLGAETERRRAAARAAGQPGREAVAKRHEHAQQLSALPKHDHLAETIQCETQAVALGGC